MRRACLLVALAASCEEPDYWAFSSGSQGTSAVVIWVSDSPTDEADQLFVTIEEVALRGPGGDVVLTSMPQEVELLALRNGRRALLALARVRSGTYDALVLRLSPSPGAHRLASRGEDRALELSDPVIEIPGPFAVTDDLDLLVDFNVRMSVLGTALRPVCAAADLATARFVDGTVVDERGSPVAGALVSAQLDGEEAASGLTDADGGFRLGPVPRSPLTLVATARGRGIATGVGPVLVLPLEDTGALSGFAAGSYVRLMRDGALVAVAGVSDGSFTLRDVPIGSYELEIWGAGGLVETRAVAR
jgi:hypothetical protein